jgi:predicted RND superfamily exporter protein
MELVRALQKKLLGIEGISGAISLADFRKPNQPRPERVDARYLRSLQVAKKRIFEQREEETREFVTHAQTPLSVVVDEIPLRVESGDEVWRIRAQCSALTNRHYGDLIAEIDSALTSELRSLPGVEHFVTGMVPLFLRTQEALLESLINSFGLAFATIGAVMMYQMRSITAGALAMLPNILPIAIVFGTVSVYGIPLDVGTMITASIAMGISVDSELHFVTWFRDCLHRGMSRDEAVSHGLAHCGPAMWQSCLVIALALQMLMFTDLLMISRFGWLMAAMTLVAMVADLVYMPALLAGLMGRVIERQVARQPSGSRSPVDAALPPEVMTTP